MNRKAVGLIAIIVSLIVIVSIISVLSLSSVLSEDTEKIELSIIQENTDQRINQETRLSVSYEGDDANTSWKIGTSEYFGKEVSLSFPISDFYQVNVTLNGKNKQGYASTILNVKNTDQHDGLQNGIPLKNFIGDYTGYQSDLEVLNGTTDPNATVDFEVRSGIGNIGFEIWLSSEESFEIIESETVTLTNNGHSFNYNIDLNEYDNFGKPYDVIINLFVYKGFITGFNFDFDIKY